MVWMIKRFLPVVVALVAGCGGGSSDLPSERPLGSISGVAVDGPIRDGEVRVFSFSDGIKGEVLATTSTGEDGSYAIDDLPALDQVMLIEVDRGTYDEEASGTNVPVPAGEGLNALFSYREGEENVVNITPFTLLVTGLVEYRRSQGGELQELIATAQNEISQIVGVDVAATAPQSILESRDPSDAVDSPSLYGFLLAGLSSYSNWIASQNQSMSHSEFPSIALVRLMYIDIRADGLLDGLGPIDETGSPSQLMMGAIPLDHGVYRSAIPQHMLVMANSGINRTGYTPEVLFEAANAIVLSQNALLPGSADAPALDIEGPVISADLQEGAYYRESMQFVASVSDASSIQSVSFDVDGDTIGFATDLANPSIAIDTARHKDGDHFVGVSAVDEVGNLGYARFPVRFDNTAPLIKVTSSETTNQNTFTLSGTYDASGAEIRAFTVTDRDGTKDVTISSDNTWQTDVALTPGRNVIVLSVDDTAVFDDDGALQQVETIVSLDKGPPSISVFYSRARLSFENSDDEDRWYSGTLDQADVGNSDISGLTPPLYFSSSTLSLGRSAYTKDDLLIAGIPFLELTVRDAEVRGVATPSDQLAVSFRYQLGEAEPSEWALLVAAGEGMESGTTRYLFPFITEALGSLWTSASIEDIHTVSFMVEDRGGNVKLFTFKFRVDIQV